MFEGGAASVGLAEGEVNKVRETWNKDTPMISSRVRTHMTPEPTQAAQTVNLSRSGVSSGEIHWRPIIRTTDEMG